MVASLLSRGDIYWVVAEVDGRVVGSNFLWENGAIAGVGPITIDPSAQNVAVGRRLMEEVLRRAKERNFAGVRLVQAAYHNRSLSLYTKLGFDVREPLSNLQGPAIEQQIPGYAVRSATEEDLDACNKMSLEVHGHHRGPELFEAISQGTANVVEHDGRITGYTTAVGFFGHTVGESNEDLKALIGAARNSRDPVSPADTQQRGVALVSGARSAHRSADDPDERGPVQRAGGSVHAFGPVLMRASFDTTHSRPGTRKGRIMTETIVGPRKTRELHNHHFDSTIWNDFRFRDDDIIIATYAKSGTTWMQQIVAQMLFGPDPELEVAEMSPWLDLRVPRRP